ncbi:hypothetical protein RKD54_001810 [Pseudarthrobacter sp. SLBN-100]
MNHLGLGPTKPPRRRAPSAALAVIFVFAGMVATTVFASGALSSPPSATGPGQLKKSPSPSPTPTVTETSTSSPTPTITATTSSPTPIVTETTTAAPTTDPPTCTSDIEPFVYESEYYCPTTIPELRSGAYAPGSRILLEPAEVSPEGLYGKCLTCTDGPNPAIVTIIHNVYPYYIDVDFAGVPAESIPGYGLQFTLLAVYTGDPNILKGVGYVSAVFIGY